MKPQCRTFKTEGWHKTETVLWPLSWRWCLRSLRSRKRQKKKQNLLQQSILRLNLLHTLHAATHNWTLLHSLLMTLTFFFFSATTTAVSMWLISSLLSVTLPFLPSFFLGLKTWRKRGFASRAGGELSGSNAKNLFFRAAHFHKDLMASVAVMTVAEKAITSR